MLPLVLPVPEAPLSEKLPNSGNQLWLLELSPMALGVVLKVLSVLPLELEEQLSLLLETLLQLGLLQGLVVALALSEPMLLLSLNITIILVKLVVLLTLSLSLSLNLSYWLSFNLLILSMSSLEK